MSVESRYPSAASVPTAGWEILLIGCAVVFFGLMLFLAAVLAGQLESEFVDALRTLAPVGVLPIGMLAVGIVMRRRRMTRASKRVAFLDSLKVKSND